METTNTKENGGVHRAIFRPWDAEDSSSESSSGSRPSSVSSPESTCAVLVRPQPILPPPDMLPVHPVPASALGYSADLLLSELWLAELDRSVMLAAGVGVEAAAKLKKASVQRPKKFNCPHCDVCFSNNGQLKSHIRIHTGERPFACEHDGCGKTFTRNEELTRHRRIHSGLRPFPCPVCQKPFGRKDHLKKHVKTHQRMVPAGLPFYPAPFW
ncbi:Krueppel-like factor 16 [Varroa destructor]|uniref:C2H2-type domain-containing protein n=1 Tax=Varroa destructor TaxID=109461 RepID=A0A7M7KQI3_VARDE|nr:Krueppel-like factor 16 [Varroa destructor]